MSSEIFKIKDTGHRAIPVRNCLRNGSRSGRIPQTASDDAEISSGKTLPRKPPWLEQRSKRKCAKADRDVIFGY